jgi:superfamily II DNA or RNA helicase
LRLTGAGKTVCFADMAHKHIQLHEGKQPFVWFLVHRRELVHQTEDTFKEFNIPKDNVFIGMVQTITRHPERYKKPTLIIFDEAHHAKAKSWYNIIDYFEGVPMIGLTATPIRRDGKALGDIFDTLVEGEDASSLISQGWLSEYDYYAPKTDILEYKMRGMDFDMNDVTAQLMKSKIYGKVEDYIDKKRKTIIYCPSIEFSKALCDRVDATHFDGNTPKKERDRIVNEFKQGKIKVLSNVDLIGEGFDVPDCDTVILLRPTLSLSLYIQQAMRCLRPSPDKRAKIYDLVGNCYRHGLPTDKRDWSLKRKMTTKNKSGEPDILVRRCDKCQLIYSGTASQCPYCSNDNGKTRREIEQERSAELEKIEKIEKKNKRMEIGRARTYDELVKIAIDRGYKAPQWWAKKIINSRRKKI